MRLSFDGGEKLDVVASKNAARKSAFLRGAIFDLSTVIKSDLVLLPSARVLAQASNVSEGAIAADFEGRIRQVTGLQVIKFSGYLLTAKETAVVSLEDYLGIANVETDPNETVKLNFEGATKLATDGHFNSRLDTDRFRNAIISNSNVVTGDVIALPPAHALARQLGVSLPTVANGFDTRLSLATGLEPIRHNGLMLASNDMVPEPLAEYFAA